MQQQKACMPKVSKKTKSLSRPKIDITRKTHTGVNMHHDLSPLTKLSDEAPLQSCFLTNIPLRHFVIML